MKTTMTAPHVVPMIGDPVAQAATPALWNAHFRTTGRDAVCVPLELPPEGLASFVAWVRHARNVPGFVTTVPHKAALPALCDVLEPEVEILGTANTVVRLGDGRLAAAMFDGIGMTGAMRTAGARFEGATLGLCGAGAAGGAIAVAALRSGVARICLADRDAAAAERLLARLEAAYPNRAAIGPPPAGSLLVNASPAGSHGEDSLPFDADRIAGAALAAEAVTDPAETRFLALARASGVPCVSGTEMAAHQAAAMRGFLCLE